MTGKLSITDDLLRVHSCKTGPFTYLGVWYMAGLLGQPLDYL